MSEGTLVGSLNIVGDSEVARVSASSIRGRFLTNNVIIGRPRARRNNKYHIANRHRITRRECRIRFCNK